MNPYQKILDYLNNLFSMGSMHQYGKPPMAPMPGEGPKSGQQPAPPMTGPSYGQLPGQGSQQAHYSIIQNMLKKIGR